MPAKGIRLPFRASPTGGIATLEGDEYIVQMLMVALGDCDSDNPFQDIGLGSGAIFANLSDQGLRALIRSRVERISADFQAQRLARISSIDFRTDSENGELILDLKWKSMETEQELAVSRRFSL